MYLDRHVPMSDEGRGASVLAGRANIRMSELVEQESESRPRPCTLGWGLAGIV